jgi:hypothetical protein
LKTGDGLGRAFDGERRGCGDDHDHVGFESNHLGGKLRKPIRPTLRIPTLGDEVPSLHVSKLPEAMKERVVIFRR